MKAFRWTNGLKCPIALRASDAESMPEEIWLVTQADARSIERIRVVSNWLLAKFVEHADWLAGGPGPQN